MKKNNPYATMSTKPIKAPKKPAAAPKAERAASDVDMRAKVTK